MLYLILIAIYMGWLEQFHFRSGSKPWYVVNSTELRPKWIGWVIPAYHIPLALGWFLICLIQGELQFFPAFCILEDWGYWRFHPQRLDQTKSVCSKLGGFYLYGNETSKNNFFVAWIYIIGILITLLLYIIF